MEEQLIEAVRNEKCLYDVKQPHYNNPSLKKTIWKRIAKAQNLKDADEAKGAWEKLRNSHRDALRRQKKIVPKSRSGTVNRKSWRFQENMAFLMPYMAKRLTNTDIREDIQNDQISQAQSDTTEIDVHGIDNEESQSSLEEIKHSIEEPSTNISSDQVRKRVRHNRSFLDDCLDRSIEERQPRITSREREGERLITNATNDFTVNNVKNDPLFHFFLSMYETTKTLPPLSQHTIKTNIFSLVSQEESKILLKRSPCPLPNNTQFNDTGT